MRAVGAECTAFVREVLLPGDPEREVRVDPRYARFALKLVRSHIHGWGVIAEQDIPARRRVIEYTGQRVTQAEAWRRMWRPIVQLFHLNSRYQVDGGVGGSGAELINHSCDPNLVARRAKGRIHLVSLRPIRRGEELLLDYQLSPYGPVIACKCGAPNCRGTINVIPPGLSPSRRA